MDVFTFFWTIQKPQYCWCSKQTLRTAFRLQQGQSLVESLIIMSAGALIWIIPVTPLGHSIVAMVTQLVQTTAMHFDWIWNSFTLNPLVW